MVNPNYKTLLSAQYLVDCDTSNYGCSGNPLKIHVFETEYTII